MTSKVAVYGSLRKGMGNNRLLGDSKCLGVTTTDMPFAMYSLGGFPMVTFGDRVCPIVVEVYECSSEVLQTLNYLEGYRGEGGNNFYDRSLVATPLGEAYIYHIEDRSTSPDSLVPNGDWVNYVQQRGSRY